MKIIIDVKIQGGPLDSAKEFLHRTYATAHKIARKAARKASKRVLTAIDDVQPRPLSPRNIAR